MRRTTLAIASVLLVLAATSCKKETENDLSNRPVRFTATIEESQNDNKTQLSGYNLVWQEGDEVAVVCTGVTSKEIYLPQNAGRQVGFVYGGDMANEPTLETPIKAGYPADYFSNDLSTITLPCHQNYVANSMEKFPMYGETETHGINFKNMCGVLRVRLVKPGENVTKIAVTTTTHINGTYSVSMNSEGLPVMEHVSGGTNGDTLYCAEPVSIDNATNFYIYLPAGSYSPMRIEVFNDRGLLCSMESTVAINIERNKITTVAPPANKLNFTLVSGLISVSANLQVRFASGNLVRENGEWRFADNQYDIYNSQSDRTIRDKFGWSTATTNYGLNSTSSTCTGDFVDWGELFGSESNWRTLSISELTWTRVGQTSQYSDSYRGCKAGSAKIMLDNTNYAEGIVLMPDNFKASDLPSGITFYCRKYNGTRPAGVAEYQENEWTLSQWEILEKEFGAVFIPCGNTVTGVATGQKSYWTSSPSTSNTDGTKAQTFNIVISNTLGGTTNAGGRTMNYFVRLAQNYEPLVISGSSSTGM